MMKKSTKSNQNVYTKNVAYFKEFQYKKNVGFKKETN